VETIFSRHQNILDEWWRREIEEDEFRERIRFDVDWGYEWSPFYRLLIAARENVEAIYGLDCMPRDDLRKIRARDRHAVDKIAEMRERHPTAVILVLFGESHLAPQHLPRVLRQRMPEERILTVLQNTDALYWSASSERQEQVDAVQVNDHVVCVFNSTPLEKYESYRQCLSRWGEEDRKHPDLAPSIYNLIDSLATFLDVNRYSPHNTTQPRFFVDLLPEVYSGSSDARLRQVLGRTFHDPAKIDNILRRVEETGCVYMPRINAFYIREFQMMHTAEEATRFLHQACRGLPARTAHPEAEGEASDRFYARSVEHALAYLGSRVLYPARPAVRDEEGYNFTMNICRARMREGLRGNRKQFDDVALNLGYSLGSELYDAYLRGSVSRTVLRHLFLSHIEQPGVARQTCNEIIRKIHSSRKKPSASVRE